MSTDFTPLVNIRKNEKVDRNKAIYEYYENFKGFKYLAEEHLSDRYGITIRRVREIRRAYKKKFIKPETK